MVGKEEGAPEAAEADQSLEELGPARVVSGEGLLIAWLEYP